MYVCMYVCIHCYIHAYISGSEPGNAMEAMLEVRMWHGHRFAQAAGEVSGRSWRHGAVD